MGEHFAWQGKPSLNIYRPPDQPLNSLSRMENSLSKIERSNCKMVLLGDFNVDFSISTKNSPLKWTLNRLMGIFDLHQLICSPTRVTSSSQN